MIGRVSGQRGPITSLIKKPKRTTTTLITSGLITHYDIQNASSYGGSGTTITDLRSINNATIVGTVPFTNSTTDYLTISGSTSNYIKTNTNLNPSLSPANTSTIISLFVWVNPSTNGTIISEQGTSTPDTSWYDAQIEWKNGTPVFGTWPYTQSIPLITSSIAAALGSWHYVGFTYDGTTLRAYVNGQAAGTSTYARQSPGNYSNGLYHTIGYPSQTNMINTHPNRALANLKFGAFYVYNVGLTSTQVLNNYNATKGQYGL